MAFGLSQREKDNDLYVAIHQQDLAKMEKALKRGADANSTWNDSTSPLFKVASIDAPAFTLPAMKLLLQHKAKTGTYRDRARSTILHYIGSYYYDNAHCIETLVEGGADIHARNVNGQTPLQVALAHGKWTAAEKFLALGGAREFTADNNGRTILMEAIEKGAPDDLVARILQLKKVDINASPEKQSPALILATQKNAGVQTALLLSTPGIYIDIRDPAGRTPLNVAVQNGNLTLVKRLIAARATLDLAGDDSITPLAYAASSGNQEIAEALIAAGAALDLPSGDGRTPLYFAAANGNIRMVVTLLEAAKEKGQTLALDRAFAEAAERGHGRVVELLIAAGADLNARDKAGRTPLMRAVASDQPETLGILINAGAKPELVDDHKLDAYDHAVSQKKNLAKSYLGRYRTGAVAVPAAGSTPQAVTTSADAYRYSKLSDYSLEVREGDGLSSIFNFSTQQLILRDMERPAPAVVQNFADIQRQDAVLEAYDRLKELGGNPPDPRVSSAQKKLPGLAAKQ